MKRILLTTLAAAGLAVPSLLADQYSVFRVCEDKHVLHTSDGADAGHVEYIVVDPGQQRIVSTVVTGGVIGEKHVAVPFSEMRFGSGSEVTFTKITRERFIAAPVIETSRFTSTSYIEPSYIEPTFTHFGVTISGRDADRDSIRRESAVRGERSEREEARGRRLEGDARAEVPGRNAADAVRGGVERTEDAAASTGRAAREGTEKAAGKAADATERAAEKAGRASGKAADRAVEGADRAVDKAGSASRKGAEKAGEVAGDAADTSRRAAEKAGNATQRGAEKAASSTERATEKAAGTTEHAASKAADTTERAASKAADTTEKTTRKAVDSTEKAASKTGDAVERAGRAVEKGPQ